MKESPLTWRLTSAECSVSTRTTSVKPLLTAMWSAVHMELFKRLAFAPLLNSSRAISAWLLGRIQTKRRNQDNTENGTNSDSCGKNGLFFIYLFFIRVAATDFTKLCLTIALIPDETLRCSQCEHVSVRGEEMAGRFGTSKSLSEWIIPSSNLTIIAFSKQQS